MYVFYFYFEGGIEAMVVVVSPSGDERHVFLTYHHVL